MVQNIPLMPRTTSKSEQPDLSSAHSKSDIEDSAQEPLQSSRKSSESYPRTCWICYSDETEDMPTTSAWRSPCPCALTAHEACLLDWVADLENPKEKDRLGSTPRIRCPQCKADITIARPTSLVVRGVQAVDRMTSRLILPGIVLSVAGGIFSFCWLSGVAAVYVTFDRPDFKKLTGFGTSQIFTLWRSVRLSLIPVILISSSTSVADKVLPIVPLLCLPTRMDQLPRGADDLWPPTASMTFSVLPYIYGLYKVTMRHFFAERERRWIQEVLPRASETTNADSAQEAGDEPVNLLNVGDLQIDLEIIAEEEAVEIPDPNELLDQRLDGQAEDQAAGDAAPNLDGGPPQAHGNGAPIDNEPQNGAAGGTMTSIFSSTPEVVLGALAFPAIASVVGSLMKLGLPAAWTTNPLLFGSTKRPTLLQTRWGRTVLGGCLFVVVKDTLLLYTRYKLADGHRKRRVVDWDAGQGRRRAGSSRVSS